MAVFKCDVFGTKIANNIVFEVRSRSGKTQETFDSLQEVAGFLNSKRKPGVDIEVNFDAPCGIFWGLGVPRQHWRLERSERGELYVLLHEICRRG